jgi:hypothetical protein
MIKYFSFIIKFNFKYVLDEEIENQMNECIILIIFTLLFFIDKYKFSKIQ